jgi:hypothetical protein
MAPATQARLALRRNREKPERQFDEGRQKEGGQKDGADEMVNCTITNEAEPQTSKARTMVHGSEFQDPSGWFGGSTQP